MGPQLYRCGNLADYELLARRHDASMGPQLYRCGNMTLMCESAVYCFWLQWGRNFIVAEICPVGRGEDLALRASMGPQLYRCGNA